MKVDKKPKKIVIDFDDDEDEIVEHLIETRGPLYIQEQLQHWFNGRIATVKEELKTVIAEESTKSKTIKQLKQEVRLIKQRRNN